MAYPDKTTPRSYGGSVPGAYITSDIPAYYATNQTITISNAAGWYEVDDTGQATTNPLGTRGPFVIAVNLGAANEEKILCSSINIADSFITVWTDGVLNGRGYDATIIATHNHQTTQNKVADTFHVSSAVESLQFNKGIIAALQGGQGGQGAQGYQGAQGAQGAQGETGTGTQGSQGAQGAQGAGTQGPQGNDGSQGSQGADGAQGSQGDLGPQGNDGAQGTQGNDGPQGNDGAQGTQGTVGASFPTYLAVINSPDGIATDGSFVNQTATFTVTGGPDAYVSPNRVTLIVSGGSCSYTGYISDIIPGVGTTTFQVYIDGYTGTNSGDQINWYMSLSGIQGIQGAQGAQGNDGSQGAQGNDGNQGAQGNDGAQGAQGYQGQADKYATYSAAYTNIPTIFPFTDDISVSGGLAYSAGQGIVIAIDGADYAVAVVNTYDAVTGILNFTIAASTDVHGNPFQGFSWGYAVNLDGAVGAQGTQGYQGDQGPQGNDGSQGPQGNDGSQGAQGNDGAQGSQGNDGAQGSQGNDGSQGAQGNDGSQGSQGNDGSQGPQGTDALWNFSGPYNPGLIYTTGDVVTYEGQTWYRLIYGAPGRTPGDNIWWTLVAAEGNQGAQGTQGLTGDPGIYESADGVPPVNEDILWLDETVAGYAGPQGPQGVQGVQGARGYQGSVGAQGANGTNGTNGSQGSQGVQGFQGSTGSQGSQGNAGTQGPQGASGTNGSQGPQGSQGNQGTVGSYTTSDSGWIAVSSFTNSFVVGAAVAYRKLNGIVYLRGSVQSGTPANAAFTLPTGYRPSETSVFAIQQYGLTTNNYVTINTDGTVVPQTASSWLNNVVYPIG